MQNKSKLFIFLLMILCSGSLYAAKAKNHAEPKRGKILVIGKIAYSQPIDTAAREEAFTAGTKWQPGKEKDFWHKANFKESSNTETTEGLDGYFYAELKPSKDGTVHLNSFSVAMFSSVNWYNQFNLPGEVTINVPDDAVYLYIGTFEYELDYALRTVGFRHLDEYERAQKDLSREIGKEIELYRGVLTFDE